MAAMRPQSGLGKPRDNGERRGQSPYPESVNRLIDLFGDLPGIGRKSAERLAFHLLKGREEAALSLAKAIEDVKRNVRPCSVCSNLTEADPCAICSDPRRDRSVVLVVEQPKDLIALEQTGMHRGLYHVLMGCIAPLDGVGPEDLTIDALLQRVTDPPANPDAEPLREVILGLNPTLEGDGTSLYLAERLRPLGVKVSRLARGLPSGRELEFASKAVLADALAARQSMEEGA
jgi:recombination protein RecR